MSFISPGRTRKKFRRFSPQGIPQVDKSHPLASGMTSCFVALSNGLIIDALRPRGVQAGSSSAIGPHGVGVRDAAFSQSITTDLNWTGAAFTAACWAAGAVGQSAQYINFFGRYNYVNESSNQGWVLQWRPSGDFAPGYDFCIFNNNDVGTYPFQSGVTTYTSADICLLFRTDGATFKDMWINGAQANSTSPSSPASNTTGGVGIGIATYGAIYIACTWNKALAAPDIGEFYDNPYGMLSYPDDTVPWIGIAAGAPGFTAVNRRTLGPRVGSRSFY